MRSLHVFPAARSSGWVSRALAMKPELLLFDEPTGALDPELVGEVLAMMRDLACDGMTMVVVTHEMPFAREAASRIVFMDRGAIVETGHPDVSFSAPSTERVRQFLQHYSGAPAGHLHSAGQHIDSTNQAGTHAL
jgi:polar amino acid transport system ATP-binding protein